MRRILKALLLTISTIMFLIQLREATLNLIYPSIVVSTREVDISEVDLPLITICPLNQTNKAMLTKLGYQRVDTLFQGFTKCNNKPCLSWGAFLNMTFNETINEVFNPEFLNSHDIIATKTLLPRFGICQEIAQFNPFETVKISNLHSFRVFTTDKQYKTYFSLDYRSHIGSKIIVQPYKVSNFNVKIVISSSCLIRNNETRNYQFGSCIEDKIQDTVQGKKLDCIAPWLSENN